MSRVVVLGAGPAGLAAALELAERGFEVTVLESRNCVGGNAGSFTLAGVRVDYGSHRFHPAANPRVLARLQSLLGVDLVKRPRHGRIRLLNRWVHFPLRPLDLALRLDPRFAMGVGLDMLRKLTATSGSADEESFGTVLERGLGATICREFYFPYARKIWGLEPTEISATQAYKRVSSGSLTKLLLRLAPRTSGQGGASTKGIFYYPRRGFGQISEALCSAATLAGASIVMNAGVRNVILESGNQTVVYENNGELNEVTADQVFSTIPITVLTKLISPRAPEAVIRSADSLEFRAMLLVYLVLKQDRFTQFDAHYFPGREFPFTRISEPKNYSGTDDPPNCTVLCAEIPCKPKEELWSLPAAKLGEIVANGLAIAGLPLDCGVDTVEVRRIPHAYPLYRVGYERHFDEIDRWISGLEGVLTFGRQGLYAHDNTHHAMYMAQSAARCIKDDGSLDRQDWYVARKAFEQHVVED